MGGDTPKPTAVREFLECRLRLYQLKIRTRVIGPASLQRTEGVRVEESISRHHHSLRILPVPAKAPVPRTELERRWDDRHWRQTPDGRVGSPLHAEAHSQAWIRVVWRYRIRTACTWITRE